MAAAQLSGPSVTLHGFMQSAPEWTLYGHVHAWLSWHRCSPWNEQKKDPVSASCSLMGETHARRVCDSPAFMYNLCSELKINLLQRTCTSVFTHGSNRGIGGAARGLYDYMRVHNRSTRQNLIKNDSWILVQLSFMDLIILGQVIEKQQLQCL